MRNQIIEEDLQYIINSDLPWGDIEGKTVLISGANGFLPTYMVETLLYLNERRFKDRVKVVAVVRNKERGEKRFSEYLNRDDFVLVVQDICTPLAVEGSVDYIIHAASQASPKYYGVDPVGTLSANILGTFNLLEFARKKTIRDFLFFSSGEVYGEVAEKQMPIKEDCYGYLDPLNVRSCYAESKRMGETMCISWSHQFGIPVKIIRPFHTYGPGMNPDDGRVFADFVADIVRRRDIIMKSDGSALRAFCYLADATLGFFTVLLRGGNREAYNIGNNKEEVSILHLANTLVDLFPDRGLKVIRKEISADGSYLKSKINRSCPDITKMSNLGWKPHYSIEEGFNKTIRSFL